MAQKDISELFKDATKAKKQGKYHEAMTIYENILEISKEKKQKRRALIQLFNTAINVHSPKAHLLFEEIIQLGDLNIEEKNSVVKYYMEQLKAYYLAQALVDEILETNPLNKTALESKEKINYYIAQPIDTSIAALSIEEENEQYLFRLINDYISTNTNLFEVVPIISELTENKKSKNQLLALLLLEHVYNILNMEYEKEETITKIQKYAYKKADRIAAIRTIIFLEHAINNNANLLDLLDVDYTKQFSVAKGTFKSAADKNKIKVSLPKKLSNGVLIFKTHNIYVYNIEIKNAGTVKKETVNYIAVICLGTPRNIREFFPSEKLYK